jgi:hypothetical protein
MRRAPAATLMTIIPTTTHHGNASTAERSPAASPGSDCGVIAVRCSSAARAGSSDACTVRSL